MEPIIEIVNNNGEIKVFNDLSPDEQYEIRKRITNRLIEAFVKDINKKVDH